MGPGHFGVALAAKPLAPKAPLWTLLVASEALDILCFGFLALGMEKMAETQVDLQNGIQTITPGSVPWSHGLFMSIVWSILFAMIAYLAFKDWKASGVIGLVTFSHWFLDLIVHTPDLPIFFHNSPKLGLGLWASGTGLVISLILEILLIGVGVAIYLRWRREKGD